MHRPCVCVFVCDLYTSKISTSSAPEDLLEYEMEYTRITADFRDVSIFF